MKRRYNTTQLREKISLMRQYIPEIQLTADIIVGFPGEAENHFEQTSTFLEEIHLLDAHIFTYSKRTGTPAATMPNQVPKSDMKRRSAILTEQQNAIRKNILAGYIGKKVDVVAEEVSGNNISGTAANSASVYFTTNPTQNISVKDIVQVKIISSDNDKIIGFQI